jgi:predicted nucleic acid-binding protein
MGPPNKQMQRTRHSHVVAAAFERFAGKASVSFSDCLVLEVARRSGHLPLGTFDRELAQLNGAERV